MPTAPPPSRSRRRRLLWRIFALLGIALLLSAALIGCQGFGQITLGARLPRIRESPQWQGGRFVNPQPLHNDWLGAFTGSFHRSQFAEPKEPVPMQADAAAQLQKPPPSGLRVTWIGHSTTLVEIDGLRILTDPIFSPRVGPVRFVGPRRFSPLPLSLSQLPHIDAVLISHDHYDHLDHRTLIAMADWDTTFIVPLGVGAHLVLWGIRESRIIELDWWQSARLGALQVVATPARHAAGRVLIDDDRKLWAGYALIGPQHRIYFSGDTGLFPAMREIGARLGPFDLSMIEVGQYGSAWPDWHIGPEAAVLAHQLVRARLLLPIHWGAFALAFHGWTEPIERTLLAATVAGVSVVVPKLGQSIEPASPPPLDRWWPQLPFQTASQAPLRSTQVESLYR